MSAYSVTFAAPIENVWSPVYVVPEPSDSVCHPTKEYPAFRRPPVFPSIFTEPPWAYVAESTGTVPPVAPLPL